VCPLSPPKRHNIRRRRFVCRRVPTVGYTWAGSFVDGGHRWEENETFNLQLYIDLDLGRVGRTAVVQDDTDLIHIRHVIASTTNALPTRGLCRITRVTRVLDSKLESSNFYYSSTCIEYLTRDYLDATASNWNTSAHNRPLASRFV